MGPSGTQVYHGKLGYFNYYHHSQCSPNPQRTPFENIAFANTFRVATYGTTASGGFGFVRDHNVDTQISEVSLYLGATVCGWVSIYSILYLKFLIRPIFKLITAIADYKNPNIVDWPDCTARAAAEDTIRKVYGYFFKVMMGLRGKSMDVQNHWRAALVNFLQETRVNLPPLTNY